MAVVKEDIKEVVIKELLEEANKVAMGEAVVVVVLVKRQYSGTDPHLWQLGMSRHY